MIPAPEIPRSATPIVAVALVVVAGLGGYFGYSHATPPPGGEAAATTPTAVAAKAATPIPDSAPVAAVADEAFIRKIAREEAEAALHPKHAAPPPDADDDASDAAGQPTPATVAPSSSPATSAPAAPAPLNATQGPTG
jgi:hypothetical protein